MTTLGHSSSTPFPLLCCFYLKRPIIKSFNKTLRCTAEDSERLELKTTNMVAEQSSLESQYRGCAKTPILKVCKLIAIFKDDRGTGQGGAKGLRILDFHALGGKREDIELQG